MYMDEGFLAVLKKAAPTKILALGFFMPLKVMVMAFLGSGAFWLALLKLKNKIKKKSMVYNFLGSTTAW